MGIGASAGSIYITGTSNHQQKKYTEDLAEVLKDDSECSRQFEEELNAINLDWDIEFELYLKNGLRKYKGRGIQQLKQITKKILPSLRQIKIKDANLKKLLRKLLEAVDLLIRSNEESSKLHKADLVTKTLTALGGVGGIAQNIGREGAEEMAKIFGQNAAKVAGGVAIGLGGVFLLLDVHQIYKDWKKESIGQMFEALANAICCLPPVDIEVDVESEETLTTRDAEDTELKEQGTSEEDYEVEMEVKENLTTRDEEDTELKQQGSSEVESEVEENQTTTNQKKEKPLK